MLWIKSFYPTATGIIVKLLIATIRLWRMDRVAHTYLKSLKPQYGKVDYPESGY